MYIGTKSAVVIISTLSLLLWIDVLQAQVSSNQTIISNGEAAHLYILNCLDLEMSSYKSLARCGGNNTMVGARFLVGPSRERATLPDVPHPHLYRTSKYVRFHTSIRTYRNGKQALVLVDCSENNDTSNLKTIPGRLLRYPRGLKPNPKPQVFPPTDNTRIPDCKRQWQIQRTSRTSKA